MKKIIGIIFLILLAGSCSKINISKNNILLENGEIKNEEIEIYELLIDTFMSRREGSFVVIEEETMILTWYDEPEFTKEDEREFFLADFGKKYEYLYDKFWENNKTNYKINSFINSHENYMNYNELLEIMEKYINENNLTGIDTYFWNVIDNIDIDICGIITLSRVAFNKNKNEALLQIKYSFGSLAMEICYVSLKKIKRTNKWEIIEEIPYIMS
jgi:hypothetical protein